MNTQPTSTRGTQASVKNRQILLASRPSGEPSPDSFLLVETEIPKPGPGQMLLRTIYLSLDPYMRGRMNSGPSYAPPVEIGEVMGGQSISEVVESNIPNTIQETSSQLAQDGRTTRCPTVRGPERSIARLVRFPTHLVCWVCPALPPIPAC